VRYFDFDIVGTLVKFRVLCYVSLTSQVFILEKFRQSLFKSVRASNESLKSLIKDIEMLPPIVNVVE